MKTCKQCKKTKELSDFYKHPTTKDGYMGKCKICNNTVDKEKRSLYMRKYKDSKPSIKEYQKEYHQKYHIEKKLKVYKDKIEDGHDGHDWVYYESLFIHKTQNFSFLKIGITKNDFETRYKKEKDYYKFCLSTWHGNKYEVKLKESLNKIEFKNNQFIFPDNIKHFDGYTECYNTHQQIIIK